MKYIFMSILFLVLIGSFVFFDIQKSDTSIQIGSLKAEIQKLKTQIGFIEGKQRILADAIITGE